VGVIAWVEERMGRRGKGRGRERERERERKRVRKVEGRKVRE